MYVLCDTWKIRHDNEEELEEGAAEELLDGVSNSNEWESIRIFNPVFETTPPDQSHGLPDIIHIITERGITSVTEIGQIAVQFGKDREALINDI